MKWTRFFEIVVGFLFVLFVVSLIAVPYILITEFPDSASAISEIAAFSTPWLIVMLLMLVFNEGIKGVFQSISGALDRMRKVSAAGAAADFSLNRNELTLTPEQISELQYQYKNIQSLAVNYFLKYVYVTIYGSQFELLKDLQSRESLSIEEAFSYYEAFRYRIDKKDHYSFDSWIKYLTDNYLISIDGNNDEYFITEEGKMFVDAVGRVDQGAKSFPY